MIRRDRERDSVRDDPGPVRYDRASPGLPRSANALPAYPAAGLVCRLALASNINFRSQLAPILLRGVLYFSLNLTLSKSLNTICCINSILSYENR